MTSTAARPLQRGAYLLLAAAFIVVPRLLPALRDHAPGLAVILGAAFAIGWNNPFSRYTAALTSPLLGVAIVGMGFGMNLIEVIHAGAHGFVYTLIGIALGLGGGALLGRWLGIQRNTMHLINVGTSICGGSAIAAAAPALKAKAHEIAIASAVVFTLNAIALLIFPIIGHHLGLSQEQFGYWAALGIHDTSSVVGATLAYGERALDIGTTVKLARALWIIPVTLLITLFAPEDNPTTTKKRIKIKVPWFIPGFLIASALVTWRILPAATAPLMKGLSKEIMVITLFLIGSNLSRDKLRELGFKPVLHGVLLWLILSTIWALATYLHLIV